MTVQQLDRKRLNYVGNLSSFMIGLGFAVRANIAPNLQSEIYEKIEVLSRAFWSFSKRQLGGAAILSELTRKTVPRLAVNACFGPSSTYATVQSQPM
jgi:hypothetical protein